MWVSFQSAPYAPRVVRPAMREMQRRPGVKMEKIEVFSDMMTSCRSATSGEQCRTVVRRFGRAAEVLSNRRSRIPDVDQPARPSRP